jgi:hypothetical protein
MNILLMYIEDHSHFDNSKIKECFREINEVTEIKEANWLGANLEATCSDETHIRLSPDHELIAIQGDEKHTLHFAFEIQSTYGGSFHITDPEGHFDMVIDGQQKFNAVYESVMAS